MRVFFIFLMAILLLAVGALGKDVTLQITGADALTLSLPEGWVASVAQVEVNGDFDAPREIIVVSPFEEPDPLAYVPHLDIYRQAQFVATSNLMRRFQYMRLPVYREKDGQFVIVEELIDESGTVIGYYEVMNEEDDIFLTADMNLNGTTWTASMKYPSAKRDQMASFISVVKSIRVASQPEGIGDSLAAEKRKASE
ncbi:MAG: hypothetical protein GX803_05185 [Lentisphaerae bacterium]|jgi:hypothetical protein|nr:hypothetical protein [Lentisphaerota bacterium]